MNSPSPKPIYVFVFLFAIFLQFSCSKDSDLLADYVIQDSQSVLIDIKVFANTNKPVIIDPINDVTNAIITEVSEPSEGTAEVNPDNTITYTPEPNTTGTDNFSVSAEVTTSNNIVTTNTSEINVTIVDSKDPVSGANVHYVTTNGKSINNGATETNAWDISKAFNSAKAGDIVYIKAGNYGNKNLVVKNSGTATAPIKFIGYTNIPGDLVSDQGSTFIYGESLNPNKMPLLKSSNKGKGVAIEIGEKFIEVENFQITEYGTALYSNVNAINLKLTNIIATNLGDQTTSVYNGKGLIIKGNKSIIKNSLVINANAEAIMLKTADESLISYCQVYADNPINPTDYYYILAGTNNAIIEYSYAERAEGLSHGGHGFDIKDLGEDNIIRNCMVKGTCLEVNFNGVKNNLFENIQIYGYGTNPKNSPTTIRVLNGANHNTFRNIYLSKVHRAITALDLDDGYVGDVDRDEVSCGYDNTFENIIVNDCNRFIEAAVHSSAGGDHTTAKAERFIFKNITLYNVDQLCVAYSDMVDFEWYNIGIYTLTSNSFNNGPGNIVRAIYKNSAYYNATPTMPSGWSSLGDPQFSSKPAPGAGGSDQFKLKSTSPWLKAGIGATPN